MHGDQKVEPGSPILLGGFLPLRWGRVFFLRNDDVHTKLHVHITFYTCTPRAQVKLNDVGGIRL